MTNNSPSPSPSSSSSSSSSAMANAPVLFAQNLPLGWRFAPTDQQLVGHYLKRKRHGDPIEGSDIVEVIKFCNYNPGDLAGLSKNKSTDKVWFFFYLREYRNNSRLTNRKAGNGYWKITGDPRSVTQEGSDEEIGTKRILVFHNPDATNWVMHEYEYTAELDSPIQGNYVLCKLKEKPNEKKKTVKRSKKEEPICKKPRAQKKARKGESASVSASASENKISEEIRAYSAYGEGEPRNSNHIISDLSNQNSKKMAAIATNDKGEASNVEALDYDNQSLCEVISISTCNTGETSSLIASTLGNQKFSQMTDVSSYKEGETIRLMASDIENYNPNEMTAMSSYKNSKPSYTTSGLQDLNSYEITTVSSNNKGEASPCMTNENQNSNEMAKQSFPFQNQNSNEMAKESFPFQNQNSNEMPNESFYLQNQNHNSNEMVNENENSNEMAKQSFHFQNENSNEMAKSFHFQNENSNEMAKESFPFQSQNSNEMAKESFYEKGKPTYLDSLDLKNQNPSKSSNISASTKGVWSSLLETPSDFDNQNQPEKTDVSPLKHYPSSYMAYNAGEKFQAAQSQYEVPVIPNPLMNFNSQEEMLQNQYSSIFEDDYLEEEMLPLDWPWTFSGRGENTFSETDLQLWEDWLKQYTA